MGRQTDVVVKGYGRDCKVKGKSGVQHQIDVLTTHSDGIHSYEMAIECKYWYKKVNKDVVMKLSSIREDAGISKGIIVTKRGFTKDGQDYAKFANRKIEKQRIAKNSTTATSDKYFPINADLQNLLNELGYENYKGQNQYILCPIGMFLLKQL